jgi:hypothetical protein
MTLVQELKSPAKAVLNCSPMNKSVLISVNNFQDVLLQSICQKFGNEFERGVQQGNWPKV